VIIRYILWHDDDDEGTFEPRTCLSSNKVKEKQFGILHILYSVTCDEGIGHSVVKARRDAEVQKTTYFHQKAKPSPRPELWPMKDKREVCVPQHDDYR